MNIFDSLEIQTIEQEMEEEFFELISKEYKVEKIKVEKIKHGHTIHIFYLDYYNLRNELEDRNQGDYMENILYDDAEELFENSKYYNENTMNMAFYIDGKNLFSFNAYENL